MGGGFLNVAPRDPGIEGGGERVPERVRPDLLGDSSTPGDAADDPPGTMPVKPAPVWCQEDRSSAAFPDRQVERLDVGAGGL